MTTNEIKKHCYKNKVTAGLSGIRKGVASYNAIIENEEGFSTFIYFQVPVSDMGESTFYSEMPAKLLLRWLSEDMTNIYPKNK